MLPRLARPQVGLGLVGTVAGTNRAGTSAAVLLAAQGAAAGRLGRQLPAGAPLLY